VRREKKDLAARNTFTKGDRLVQRSEFLILSRTGIRFQNRLFIAAINTNIFGSCRLGITVTRKVGNAVCRNRIKRLAREYFRQKRQIFKKHWDISIIVKRACADSSNKAVFSALEQIFDQIADYTPK
jgi:ribonuclease P protein component